MRAALDQAVGKVVFGGGESAPCLPDNVGPLDSQFSSAQQCFQNKEGGCTFDDVVDMTTDHVNMSQHLAVFREVKNRLFPCAHCAWTRTGVSEPAPPGLRVEIKCVAVQR